MASPQPGPKIITPLAGPDLGDKPKPASHVDGPHVEVTVARGHTLVAGAWNNLGQGTHYGPGAKALVPERDVERLVKLGVILTPQTEAEPVIEEPPPLEQPVPNVQIGADAS